MIKFVINPSHQPGNKCKMGDSEQDHCYLIAKSMYDNLLKYEGITPILVPAGSTLADSINYSNSVKADYHLDIHTDAGGYAKGSSGLYVSLKGKEFINVAYEVISKLTPTVDVGVKQRTDLGVLNQTRAIAGLIEICFHDNETEGKWLHANLDLIGYELATAYAQHWNLKKKEIDAREVIRQKLTEAMQLIDKL